MGNQMQIGGDELVTSPDADAINELRQTWSWLLPERYEPVLFSALGDVFYETTDGEVWWLNTGTAELQKIARTMQEFQRLLGTECADHWFLPSLIEKLRRADKILAPGQCYTFVRLPIFAEGTYTIENLNPVPAKEHFGLTGELHKQIRHLKDGDKVRLRIVE